MCATYNVAREKQKNTSVCITIVKLPLFECSMHFSFVDRWGNCPSATSAMLSIVGERERTYLGSVHVQLQQHLILYQCGVSITQYSSTVYIGIAMGGPAL